MENIDKKIEALRQEQDKVDLTTRDALKRMEQAKKTITDQ